MNIVSKTLFILSFLILANTSSSLFGMQKNNKEIIKSPKHQEFDPQYTDFRMKIITRPTVHNHGQVKCEKNRWNIFGLTWAQESFVRETTLDEKTLHILYYERKDHNFGLRKKTKALLGTAFACSIIGVGYYFNWFRKK